MFDTAQHASTDDAGSTFIQLVSPFLYFGRQYTHLYLSVNGFLSFEYLFTDGFIANLNNDIIAPLWTDIEAYIRGNITYEQVTSGPLIKLATDEITQMIPGIKFTASWVFVATWEKVEFEPSTGELSFQVVLISDSDGRSFIVMNYGAIPSDPQAWLAGYKTLNNSHSFTIDTTSTSQLSSTTNVGMPGRWVFRVDHGVSVPPALFFPTLPGAVQHAVTMDGEYAQIQLDHPFVYFGTVYSQIYLSIDGFLSFEPLIPDVYIPGVNKDMIAPLWTDIGAGTRGNVSYLQATNGSLIELATYEINRMFPALNFSASWVLVGTWEKMEFKPDTGEVTFQVVLISDSRNRFFVLMNYGSIPTNPLPWMAGYLTENRSNFFSIDVFSTSNLSSTTNVGIPGRWAFCVDVAASESSPLFYPFGSDAGDSISPLSDDGSSPAFGLWRPFSYFGRNYSQLFVNNNGYLTFDQPSSSYVPAQFDAYSGGDVIAPFWTDIDNRGSGVISYKEYTNGSVLSRATQDINQYFPGVNFTASWVFVATWDKVAYYSYSGTETSFQVVLISDGGFSFVLMNYGNIAPTSYEVKAGYDTNLTEYFVSLWSNNTFTASNFKYSSNVNVPGRWAFLVNQPRDAITTDHVLAMRLKAMSRYNLTDTNNQHLVIQQVMNELRKTGLYSTVKVKVKKVQKNSP